MTGSMNATVLALLAAALLVAAAPCSAESFLDKVEHGAEHAAHEVVDWGNRTAHKIVDWGNSTYHKVTDYADNHTIEDAAEQAKDGIEGAAHSVVDWGNSTYHEIKNATRSLLSVEAAHPGVPNFTVCDINVRCPAPQTCCCVSHSFMTGKCHGYTCCAAGSVCSKRRHACVPPSPFGAQAPPSLGASNSFEDAVRKAERAIDRAADKAAERVRRFADKIDGKGDQAKPEDAKALSAPAPSSLALTSSDFEDAVHRATRAVEKAARKAARKIRHFAHEIDGRTGAPAKEDEAVTKF